MLQTWQRNWPCLASIQCNTRLRYRVRQWQWYRFWGYYPRGQWRCRRLYTRSSAMLCTCTSLVVKDDMKEMGSLRKFIAKASTIASHIILHANPHTRQISSIITTDYMQRTRISVKHSKGEDVFIGHSETVPPRAYPSHGSCGYSISVWRNHRLRHKTPCLPATSYHVYLAWKLNYLIWLPDLTASWCRHWLTPVVCLWNDCGFMGNAPTIPHVNTGTVEAEIQDYLSTPCIPEDSDAPSTGVFTKSHHTLSKLTIKYLGIPSSYATVERLFSIAGKIFRPDRCRLVVHPFEQLVCINHNSHFS